LSVVSSLIALFIYLNFIYRLIISYFIYFPYAFQFIILVNNIKLSHFLIYFPILHFLTRITSAFLCVVSIKNLHLIILIYLIDLNVYHCWKNMQSYIYIHVIVIIIYLLLLLYLPYYYYYSVDMTALLLEATTKMKPLICLDLWRTPIELLYVLVDILWAKWTINNNKES
jgi:hypothetical protein